MATGKITTVRLDRDILLLLERLATRLEADRSSILRRAVRRGARELLLEDSITRYQAGRISLGRAAQDAGISTLEFVVELQERKLPIRMDEEGIRKDLERFRMESGRGHARRR